MHGGHCGSNERAATGCHHLLTANQQPSKSSWPIRERCVPDTLIRNIAIEDLILVDLLMSSSVPTGRCPCAQKRSCATIGRCCKRTSWRVKRGANRATTASGQYCEPKQMSWSRRCAPYGEIKRVHSGLLLNLNASCGVPARGSE